MNGFLEESSNNTSVKFLFLCWLIQLFEFVSMQVKLKQGLKTAMAISSEGNAYLQVSLQVHCISKITINESSLAYIEVFHWKKQFLTWRVAITLYSVVQESQFWKLYKEDQAACAVVMRTSAGLVYLLACLLEPFMPSFSVEVIELDYV